LSTSLPNHSLSPSIPEIRLLQACADPENERDQKFVKYLTIDAGLFDIEDMCFGPTLISLLPFMPKGDWKIARIYRDTESGVVGFSELSKRCSATLDDLPLCQQKLRRLRNLGIKHGDINRHNILVYGEETTLIYFDNASRGEGAEILSEEFQRLEDELRDASGRVGSTIVACGQISNFHSEL
jgi:hypothetical protein